jgi:Na+-driven multidrug efflux pump
VLLTGSVIALLEVLDTHAYGLFLAAGSEAMRAAGHINRIATPSFVFFGVSMVLFGVVRATGAVMAPLISLTISLLLVRVPLAEAFLDRWGADSVWWSFPLSSALSAVLAVLYYKYGGWRTARMENVPAAPVEPQSAEGA